MLPSRSYGEGQRRDEGNDVPRNSVTRRPAGRARRGRAPYATSNRKARRFAAAMERMSDTYPNATRIHVILDTPSNTPSLKSQTDAYGDREGRRF